MTDPRVPSLTEHLPAMLRFARSLTRDATAADDLVQDVAVRALERQAQFDPARSYRSWLMALTHNLFIDGWRRNRVRETARLGLEAWATDTVPPNQEHSVILTDTLRGFQNLPDEQRAVLHLVVVDGASYAEAAEILGTPVGTVMSRLSRARAALRTTDASPRVNPLRLVSDRD